MTTSSRPTGTATTLCSLRRAADVLCALGLLLIAAGSILTMTTGEWWYVAFFAIGAIEIYLAGSIVRGLSELLITSIERRLQVSTRLLMGSREDD